MSHELLIYFGMVEQCNFYFPIEWYSMLPISFHDFKLDFINHLNDHYAQNGSYEYFIYQRNNVTAQLIIDNDDEHIMWMQRIKIEGDDRDEFDGYYPPLPNSLKYKNKIPGDFEAVDDINENDEKQMQEEENWIVPENIQEPMENDDDDEEGEILILGNEDDEEIQILQENIEASMGNEDDEEIQILHENIEAPMEDDDEEIQILHENIEAPMEVSEDDENEYNENNEMVNLRIRLLLHHQQHFREVFIDGHDEENSDTDSGIEV